MVRSFIFAKIAFHALVVELRDACWYVIWQWWLQFFSLGCSGQRKGSLPIAITSNQRFCSSNFEIKQGNWIIKLVIHNMTIYNGNTNEIEKHPQIKSEVAFTIYSICRRFMMDNINTTYTYIVHFDYIWALHRCLCSRYFSSYHNVWRSIHTFNIYC